jgi:peptide chain release factor 3
MAHALDGAPAFMAASVFDLKYDQDTCPEILFPDLKNH